MRFGYYLFDRRLRLLCGRCATKRGLTHADFVEEPDRHIDCADCGRVMSPIEEMAASK